MSLVYTSRSQLVPLIRPAGTQGAGSVFLVQQRTCDTGAKNRLQRNWVRAGVVGR